MVVWERQGLPSNRVGCDLSTFQGHYHPAPVPILPAPSATMGEGGTFEFEVVLGGENQRERTYDVSFGAAGDTAQAGTNYVATPNLQVIVSKGETAAAFEVEILEDEVKELDETFTVTLQAAVVSHRVVEFPVSTDRPKPIGRNRVGLSSNSTHSNGARPTPLRGHYLTALVRRRFRLASRFRSSRSCSLRPDRGGDVQSEN